MAPPYRDPIGALRSRVELLGEQVDHLYRGFTTALWRLLPHERVEHLDELRARSRRTGADDQETLQRCLSACEEALRELERLRSELPAIQREALAVPREWREGDAENLKEVRTFYLPEQWDSLEQQIQELDPGARFVAHRAKRLSHVAFEALDAPFRLVPIKRLGVVGFELRTPVARATPSLTLEPEEWRHTLIFKPLRLTREVELGELTFDELFLVRAREEASLEVLSGRVRKALLRVAHFEVPSLYIEGGIAALRWSSLAPPELLEPALRVLVEIRQVPLELQLWRES